jgi:hypothetical protein
VPKPDDWFSLFDSLESVEREEHRIILDIGAAGMDIGDARAAVETAGEEADDREREILDLLDERHRRSGEADFKLGTVEAGGFRDLAAADQVDLARRAFESAAERRRQRIEVSLNHLMRSTGPQHDVS